MKNLKVLLILISCLLLFNCNNSSLEKKITQEGSFWYIFPDDDGDGIYENLNYGYEFYSFGKLDYKGFDISTNTLRSFRMDDVKQDLTWDYKKNKNKIRIESHIYNIISERNDTLILKYENLNKKRILINLRDKNPITLKSVKM